jgi:hypothetical protein
LWLLPLLLMRELMALALMLLLVMGLLLEIIDWL